MNSSTPDSATSQEQRQFEDEPLGTQETNLQPPSQIGVLMGRINAAINHPASVSVGDFAATLQAIEAELRLMAGASGIASPDPASDMGWDEIFAAADATATTEDAADMPDFTRDQLAAMANRSR